MPGAMDAGLHVRSQRTNGSRRPGRSGDGGESRSPSRFPRVIACSNATREMVWLRSLWPPFLETTPNPRPQSLRIIRVR
jgi:hypothetical protein